MSPPLVAVTASTRPIDGLERVRLNVAYIRAIEGAGLVPLIIAPTDSAATLDAVLNAVDGLVLTGGEDIDPQHYGAPFDPLTHPPHAGRDSTELAITRAAQERALPTLAICRGVQVANVALGGTLVQDVASQWPNAMPHENDQPRNTRVHSVTIEAGSRLAKAVNAESIVVNSSHHQALDRVAPGLRVTAVAPDGIIEGAEWADDDWWLLGVQWHPEELIETPEPWDRALFDAFATVCRARGKGGSKLMDSHRAWKPVPS